MPRLFEEVKEDLENKVGEAYSYFYEMFKDWRNDVETDAEEYARICKESDDLMERVGKLCRKLREVDDSDGKRESQTILNRLYGDMLDKKNTISAEEYITYSELRSVLEKNAVEASDGRQLTAAAAAAVPEPEPEHPRSLEELGPMARRLHEDALARVAGKEAVGKHTSAELVRRESHQRAATREGEGTGREGDGGHGRAGGGGGRGRGRG
ncbi:MAG: hypothetical protein RLN62_05755 [Rickettsiales bacterium]